jgi:uncharacterized protein
MTTIHAAVHARPAGAHARPASTARHQALAAVTFAGLSVGLAILGSAAGVSPALLPFVLALGPTGIAIAMAWREGDGAVRRLLRTAVTRPPRRLWYAIVAVPVAWAFAVIGVSLALGDPATGILAKAVPAIFIVPLVVLIPALAEEIAWRGYAVSRLLPSMSPLAAALVLAMPWAILHLFLQLPGQINDQLEIWPTLVSLTGYSVLITWVFVRTGGSALIAALLHAGFNGVAPLMAQLEVDRTWAMRALFVAGIAIAVVLVDGVRRRPAAVVPAASR